MKLPLHTDREIRVSRIRIGRVPALVLRPRADRADAPGVLWIHGGGYILGMKEMVYMGRAADLVKAFGATVVSPGYRLAWLHPYPAALEDCYQTLRYMWEHAERLGFRREKLIVGGESAGGGLAAALCMRARDEGVLRVALQTPLYPMLSNLDTETSRENHGKVWNTRRNHLGWRVYLRGAAKRRVSPYAAPAGQTDYAGLPPCYTFVGDGEPFYAETLAYVEALRAAGAAADVDVYPTDVHAFDLLRPREAMSRQAAETFLRRVDEALRRLDAGQTEN